MATTARIADKLSISPVAFINLPVAELGLQVTEREQRLSAPVAFINPPAAGLELHDQKVTVGGLSVGELVLGKGSTLALKPSTELLVRSPVAELVLEAGSTLALEKESALIVGLPSLNKRETVLTKSLVAASDMIDFAEAGKTMLAALRTPDVWRASDYHITGYDQTLHSSAGLAGSIVRPAQEAARQFAARTSEVLLKDFTTGLVGLQSDLAAPVSGGLRQGSYQTGDVFRLTGPTVLDEWKVSSDGSVPAYKLHSALPSSLHYREPDSDPLYVTVKPTASINEPTITGVQLSPSTFIVGHPTNWQLETGVHIAKVDALLEIEPVKPFYTVGQNTLSYGKPAYELLYVPEPAPLPPPRKQPPHQKSGNSGTPPAQPEQPSGDLLALLADALQSGRTQPSEVIRLVAQVAKLPPLAELQAELSELETLETAWQRARGRKTPVRFAADHGMSKATLYRRWARLKELRLLLEVWQ